MVNASGNFLLWPTQSFLEKGHKTVVYIVTINLICYDCCVCIYNIEVLVYIMFSWFFVNVLCISTFV